MAMRYLTPDRCERFLLALRAPDAVPVRRFQKPGSMCHCETSGAVDNLASSLAARTGDKLLLA